MDEVADIGLISTTAIMNTTLHITSTGELAVRSTFLAIFLILGFVGNSILIATIAQSKMLRGAVMNLFIISIAVVNITDCILNIPLILGASISQSWDYGAFACQLNVFAMQIISIVMLVSLSFMSLDRLLAVKNIYPSTVILRALKFFIGYSWLHGLVLSVPVLIESVLPAIPYRSRYSCSLAPGTTLVYLVSISILGYIIPFIITVILYILIIKTSICASRTIGKNVESNEETFKSQGRTISNTSKSTSLVEASQELDEEAYRITSEIDAAKFVGVLIILYCVFEGPYLLLTAIVQYGNSDQISSIEQVSTVLNVTYPWQLDVSFTWLKLSFPIVLPIVTFFWRREVWLKFKKCVCCHRHSIKKTGRTSRGKKHKEELSNGDMSVPVLFAAENGLQFQPACLDAEDDDKELTKEIENNNSASVASQMSAIRSRECDVFGSGIIQVKEEEDTSDYDSQEDDIIDPFSNSIPVSIKSKESKGSQASSKGSENKILSDGKLASLKEELNNAITETKSHNKENQKQRNNKKAQKKPETASTERTKRDSGNGSWEKQNGRKKVKNKNRLQEKNNTVTHVERETGDHGTEKELNDNEKNDSTNNEIEETKKAKNLKEKPKKKKKLQVQDLKEESAKVKYDNTAYVKDENDDEESDDSDITPRSISSAAKRRAANPKQKPSISNEKGTGNHQTSNQKRKSSSSLSSIDQSIDNRPDQNFADKSEKKSTAPFKKTNQNNTYNSKSPVSGKTVTSNDNNDDHQNHEFIGNFNTQKTVAYKSVLDVSDENSADDDASSNKLFQKVQKGGVVGRKAPDSPSPKKINGNKKHKRHFSDDTDIVLNTRNKGVVAKQSGCKTERSPHRFLSHDGILDTYGDLEIEHVNDSKIRPLPNPRKSKLSRPLSSLDSDTFVIEKPLNNKVTQNHTLALKDCDSDSWDDPKVSNYSEDEIAIDLASQAAFMSASDHLKSKKKKTASISVIDGV